MAAANSIDVTLLITAPELKKFILKGVELTGSSHSKGHYGEIVELKWAGKKVSGKWLHTALPSSGGENTKMLLQKFVSECELLSKLSHQNIIQFLGLCFLPNPKVHTDILRPVMVMEYINDDLFNLLDTQANIELSTKVSILLDVSRGLVHLHNHTPPVVHMDLTSSNILLTEGLQAKISDLGNAQYLNGPRSKNRCQSSSVSGCLVYMPPEAYGQKAQCSTEIDIFSFGVILLHAITQVFPGDLPAPKYTDEGLKKSKVKIRTEIERRAPYLEIAYGQLGEGHILSKMICKCLENNPKDRPTAKSVMSQLEGFKAALETKDDRESEESNTVQLRKVVRYDGIDGVDGKSTEVEKAEQRIRHQSMSFMHTHVLHGHPSVLFKFKSGGGFTKRRSTGEWQQYVFKLADSCLQCLTLKEKLQKEINLMDVKDVKAHRGANNQMFPFYIHFEGKDSPWILSANSPEERRCWMEAIKPGSTHDQWADPFLENISRKRAGFVASPSFISDLPILPSLSENPSTEPPVDTDPDQLASSQSRAQSTSDTSSKMVVALEEEQPTSCEETDIEVTVRTPTPPPRSEISLRSEPYDPYVSANEVLPQREKADSFCKTSQTALDCLDDSGQKDDRDSLYLRLLPQMELYKDHLHHDSTTANTERASEIVAELEEQFTPLEIDLLVKMLEKISAKTKSSPKSKERPKSADVHRIHKEKTENDLEVLSSSLRVGEDSSAGYHQLADLMFDLDNLEPEGVVSEGGDSTDRAGISQTTEPGAVRGRHGQPRASPYRGGAKEDSLYRKNAVRQRKVAEKSMKTVTHLRTLLKRASSEDFLDDSDEEKTAHPLWSKANAMESDTLFRFGLASPTTTEKQVIISQSDLNALVQISEGQYGPVYKATLKQRVSVEVVVKPIKKSLTKRVEFNSYMQELNLLMENSHPNVSHIYGIVYETKMIVMRYYSLGSIKIFLCKSSRSTDRLMKYMLDIAMGMHHITEKLHLVHRNLAAHNVYITEQDVCQVADMDIGLTSTVQSTDQLDPSKIRWMAPESLINGHYSTASDVWSYGITIWEVLNPTSVPYGDLDAKKCLEHITKGYVLAVSPTCPDKVGRIMRACWSQSPTKRPSFLYISHLLSSHDNNEWN